MSYDLQNFNYRLDTYVIDATVALGRDVDRCSDTTVRAVFTELFSPPGAGERAPSSEMSDDDVRTAVVSEIHHRMRDLESERAIKDWQQRGTDGEVFEFQDKLRELIGLHRES